jgi:hypothetical protein
MSLPGDQWLVRKRAYEEIRLMFEREGRKLSYRKVAVRLADAKVKTCHQMSGKLRSQPLMRRLEKTSCRMGSSLVMIGRTMLPLYKRVQKA